MLIGHEPQEGALARDQILRPKFAIVVGIHQGSNATLMLRLSAIVVRTDVNDLEDDGQCERPPCAAGEADVQKSRVVTGQVSENKLQDVWHEFGHLSWEFGEGRLRVTML
jgi:hypothetical protein